MLSKQYIKDILSKPDYRSHDYITLVHYQSNADNVLSSTCLSFVAIHKPIKTYHIEDYTVTFSVSLLIRNVYWSID